MSAVWLLMDPAFYIDILFFCRFCRWLRPRFHIMSVALIIPYRHQEGLDRGAHLAQFTGWSAAHIPATPIVVVEQSDDSRKFNRGMLLNVGFQIARAQHPSLKSVLFHDVDLIPSEELLPWYDGRAFPANGQVVHLGQRWSRYTSSSNTYFGGVVACTPADVTVVNGYPNLFWGWGGEDDAFRKRCEHHSLQLMAPLLGTYQDLEELSLKRKLRLLRETNCKCMNKWELLKQHPQTLRSDGLSSVAYTIIEEKKDLPAQLHHVVVSL